MSAFFPAQAAKYPHTLAPGDGLVLRWYNCTAGTILIWAMGDDSTARPTGTATQDR